MTATSTALDRLEQDVLDDATSLASLLRQALVMGGLASSETLRTWAACELKGYDGNELHIPSYRRIPAQLKAHIIAGPRAFTQDLAPHDLPASVRGVLQNEVPLPWGVAEIQAAVARVNRAEHIRLATHGMSDVARALTRQAGDPFVEVTSVYWSLGAAVLEGVLDQVRTRLAEFVTELRAAMPAGEREPTLDQIRAAASAISIQTGDNSPVTVTAPVAYAEKDAQAAVHAPRGKLSQR